MKLCVLENKECTNCGACDDRCELDPTKICDNCFRCIDQPDKEYLEIPISGVYLEDEFVADEEQKRQQYTHAQTLPGLHACRAIRRRVYRSR